MEKNFKEDDKQKIIDFLNIVAKKAVFSLTTSELIQYFKLLSYMQQTLLPKVEDNILEVTQIIEDKKEE